MKKFVIYRNIRKRASIYGLSIRFFTFMMLSVVLSLLVIIFSFDLFTLLGLVFLNILLYLCFLRLSQNPDIFYIRKVFPPMMSNKKSSSLYYEKESFHTKIDH